MPEIRCKLCGRSPEGDPEFAVRSFQHREAEKAGRALQPLVYICPLCAGRARFEADKEQKGSKPL
ncbi:MAG TPA: hypothetical protein VGK74_23635 [Symbiobacteriaceae bacterium]|jgi:hypothetical protein